jgi:outer membrane lipoprotein-sorting protein
MRVRRSVCTLAASITLVASCTGGSQEAKATLLDAAERTRSAESFHVESEITLPEGKQRGEADYVAPDRFRMQGFGEGASTTIHVGRDTYFDAESPETFFHYKEPCDFGVDTFFPALAFARLAEDVHRVGNTYTFQMEGEGNLEGEARVEDGYLVFLTVRYDLPLLDAQAEEQHTLSDFGSGIRIEPPPASQIEEEGPQDGGIITVDEGEPPDCSTVWEPPG